MKIEKYNNLNFSVCLLIISFPWEFSPHFKFRQKMSCFPLPCLPSLEVVLMICTVGCDVSKLWSSSGGVSFNSMFFSLLILFSWFVYKISSFPRHAPRVTAAAFPPDWRGGKFKRCTIVTLLCGRVPWPTSKNEFFVKSHDLLGTNVMSFTTTAYKVH